MALTRGRTQTHLLRLTGARSRLPLTTAVPITDVLALIATVLVTSPGGLLGWLYAAFALVSLRAIGTHAPRINPRLGDDMGLLLGGLAVPLVALAPLAGSYAEAGRFMLVGPVVASILIPVRGLAYMLIRAARARGLIRENTLILGAGFVGREVAATLREHPEYGLVPMGFLDSVHDEDLPLPLLGRTEELEAVVREWNIRRVIVAFGVTREPEMVDVIRASDHLPVEVHLIPRFFELGMSAEGPFKDDLWGIPLIRLRRSALRVSAWWVKRTFDLVVGSVAFVVTSPILALGALAVRLSSPGPIFFRQVRVGQNGEIFEMLKFRTMAADYEDSWTPDEEKITRVGRILRHTSVDELPQLINVLRGQMSLIGPRPERPYFVERWSNDVARYTDRHRMPVGITGWAQAHGLRGDDTSLPERVRFDNYYIEHWSLWRDVVIMVRTLWLIVTGRH